MISGRTAGAQPLIGRCRLVHQGSGGPKARHEVGQAALADGEQLEHLGDDRFGRRRGTAMAGTATAAGAAAAPASSARKPRRAGAVGGVPAGGVC